MARHLMQKLVMAGLVPAIDILPYANKKDLDARHRPPMTNFLVSLLSIKSNTAW
jgi:hypothetical protein